MVADKRTAKNAYSRKALDYYSRAEYYGVYIWEQLHVLDKAINEAREKRGGVLS